jgi:hypothetical protein
VSIVRIGTLAALAAAAVFIAKMWAQPPGGPVVDASATVSDEVLKAQLAKQNEILAQMTARMATMEHQLKSGPARSEGARKAQAAGDAVASGDDRPRLTPQQVRDEMNAREAEIREKGKERFATIGAGWASEPVDPGWSERHEADIRTSLGSPEFESVSLADVDCRSSVCKLDISSSSDIDIEDFNIQLAKLRPFQDTEYTTSKPEGGDPGQVVIYLARPGGEGLASLAGNP